MQRIHSFLAITVVIWTLHASAVDAQTPAPGDGPKPPAAVGEEGVKPTRGFGSSLVHNLGDDVKHMARRNSLYWLAGGTALALAVHPEDGRVNRRLLGNHTVDTSFKPGKYLGNAWFVAGASMATYGAGRWMHKSRLEHLAMDELEGAILSEGFSELAKAAFRRDRPSNPDGVQSPGYSLPSGHATVTFTAATILQQHLGYKAAIPTYLVASRAVTYHGRNFWGGPVFVPGGMALMFARR